MNDDYPVAWDAVLPRDMICRPLRVGDDRIAPHHHGIVAALKRVRSVVDAMIGGYERNTCPPRRHERAPGGGTGPRVDQLDILRPDQIRQPPRVCQYRVR